ncbi:MAG: helix-hairpin-helix domain-containing protein [Cytophagaceae bacterium]
MAVFKIQVLIFFLIIFSRFAYCQHIDKASKAEEIIYNMLGPVESSEQTEAIYEQLMMLYLHPANVNTISEEELNVFFFLSPNQVRNFIQYRQQAGKIISMYELQVIPEFDMQTIEKFILFVSVQVTTGNRLTEIASNIFETENLNIIFKTEKVIENKKGYMNGKYAGDPFKVYTRIISAKANQYSIGITMEKDPGEKFRWKPDERYYGFDFVSWHAALYNIKNINALCVGDFQMQTGQGLVFGSGLFAGKSTEPINTVRRTTLGMRKYTSVMEQGFFRGGGITLQTVGLKWTLFYSDKNIDGNINSRDTMYISLPESGYHRTETEIKGRKQIRQQDAGFNIHYNNSKSKFCIGLNYIYSQFDRHIERKPTLYNKFYFKGNNNQTGSIYTTYNIYNFNLFSEAAISPGGKAVLAGMLAGLTSKIDFSMLYRNFDPGFHSFYSNSFSENTNAQNEEGVYFGIKYKLNKKWTAGAYYDFYRFKWMRYQSYSINGGRDLMVNTTYTPGRNTRLFILFRKENKEKNTETGSLTYNTSEFDKQQFSVSLFHKLNFNLDIHSQMVITNYSITTQRFSGYFLIQDVNIKVRPFTFSMRAALFDAENYDTRTYVYERDLLYSFSMVPYYGKGFRSYLMLNCKLNHSTEAWIRYSLFSFHDREKVGSGNEEIEGNKRSDIKFQLRFHF